MTGKSLLSLVDSTMSIERMLVESGGEITPEIEAALAVTEAALPEKIDNYSLMIERFDSVSRFYKDKADFYAKLSKQCANAGDRLKDNLRHAMKELGTSELVGVDVRFKLTASQPKCVIDDEELIDPAYKTQKIEIVIDKKRLADDLKLGIPVSGAHLEHGQALRTYANTPMQEKKKAVKA